ncbi:MAG: sigma factor-like helix-turn-helix DNA-binding protein [Phycisphaerales bacterium]
MKRSRWGSAPSSSSGSHTRRSPFGSAATRGMSSSHAAPGSSVQDPTSDAAPRPRARTHQPTADSPHRDRARREPARPEPAPLGGSVGMAMLTRVKDAVLHMLSHHERLLLVLWYVERMTLAEIARTLNLTEQQADRMHAEILSKLRTA